MITTSEMPFLGIGPVSRNVVDAVLAASVRCDSRIMLIPSRSQVDAGATGPGYLGWTTYEFADYVRARDPDGRVLLCRDHGGPWQHPDEKGITDEAAAMASCAASFQHDIQAGFDLLHLDTSAEGGHQAEFDAALRRLTGLYEHCSGVAEAAGRCLRFEIGFETQGIEANDPDVFEAQLDRVLAEIVGHEFASPTFAVAQTATKVLELANTGSWPLPGERERLSGQVAALSRICRDRGVGLKAHNCDYLDPRDVADLARTGVAAINIAPELGAFESRTLLRLMHELGLDGLAERFVALAYASGKWRKWMRPDSAATDYERAVIAGHYVFQTPAFHEIRAELESTMARRGLAPLSAVLTAEIGLLIERYLLAGAATGYATTTARSTGR